MARSFGSTNAQSFASAPAVAPAGGMYYNSALSKLFVSDGAAWVEYVNGTHTHPSDTTFYWTYDSSATMANPGSGKLRTDTPAGTPCTQVSFSDITKNSIDASIVFKSLTIGDLIYVQQQDNADNWGRFTVSAAPTNNTTWWLISVTPVESHGTPITKNQDVMVRFTYGTGGGGAGGGTPEVYVQPSDPGPLAVDSIWVDVDDTSFEGGAEPHTHSEYWKHWTGTQAEYDALGTYDPTTLYIVT